jgi:ABC-type branched-subunit amino acid transport system substrate-binding protein
MLNYALQRRRFVAGGLLAALCLAAGCAGQAQTGPKPVLIGSLIPVSGVGLVFPNHLAALRAAARDVNAHGGIGGRPLQVDNCSDGNDPNQAQACARQLISDGVVATAGDASQFGMVNAPILDQAGIAQVGPSALTAEEVTLPSSFPIQTGLPGYIAGEMAAMKRRGLQRLFIVTPDTQTADLPLQVAMLAARAAQVTVVGSAGIPFVATDLSQWVQQAMRANAGVVMPLLPAGLTYQFAAASQQAGAKYLLSLIYGTLRPIDIQRLGGSRAITENSVEFAALPPLTAGDRFPALDRFRADMDAELAAGDLAAAPALRASGSLNTWLAVQVIARLAATLPTVTARTLLQALQTLPTVDTLGLTPPWTPGRTGPPLFPRITNGVGYFTTQRNGVEVLDDPTPFDSLAFLPQ